MDTERIGRDELGTFVVAFAVRNYDSIHKVVGRDPVATTINLLVAYAWCAWFAATKACSKGVCDEIARCMFPPVADVLRSTLGWQDADVMAMIRNRFEGYYAAWESGDPGLEFNKVANYFFGCCTDARMELPYEHVIPDPDALERLGDANPEALAFLRKLQAENNAVTYPLNIRKTMEVAGTLAGFHAAVVENTEWR